MKIIGFRLAPAFPFILTLNLIFTFDIYLTATASEANDDPSNLQTYIVHVRLPEAQVSAEAEDLESYYQSFLPPTVARSDEQSRIIYSYRKVVTGFAARLSPQEVKAMEEKEGFVAARLEKQLSLQTTHTPNFLGLQRNFGFWKGSNFGEGVIIGVLDTGIKPDHPSFNDDGMPPPPAKWKGKCELNGTKCNNKLIGARNFIKFGGHTTYDEDGHGTHTASTAAGSFVEGANLFGFANGTASGIAPRAHLAIYKVCTGGCGDSELLAGMDAAVEDGVDIISVSIAGDPGPFYEDSIMLAAFGAMDRGVFVSCAAGNSGPYNGTLSNEAPWVLTVGASTIDRSIQVTAKLGNMEEFNGESLYQPINFTKKLLPLVYPGQNGSDTDALCFNSGPSTFNNTNVKGKIVLCDGGSGLPEFKAETLIEAGAAAMILINEETDGFNLSPEFDALPATHIAYADGQKIKAYINSTSNPVATLLFKGTVIGSNHTPMVASFSSRGPSKQSPGILKPDIIGPGVNILAAWPVSVEKKNHTKSTFNMISGTSMSCPHLSGIVALLKNAHPDWSPAAIKSAIMTTADQLNLENKPIVDERHRPANVFAIGAGHVNPSRANDPGLLYDIQPEDYIPYLCGLSYTSGLVSLITRRKVNCTAVKSIPEAQLNYPSFSVTVGILDQTYTRTVTNIAEDRSSYTVNVVSPPGVVVKVKPERLVFSKKNQKMRYQVTFSRSATTPSSNGKYVEGFLSWTSGKRLVRSPISVKLE